MADGGGSRRRRSFFTIRGLLRDKGKRKASQSETPVALVDMDNDTPCALLRIPERGSAGAARGVAEGRSAVRGWLVDILRDLSEEDQLRGFLDKLGGFPVKEGFRNIPKGRLQKSDVGALCDRLLSYYEEDSAVEVVVEVLEAINCQHLAEKLLSLCGKGRKTEDPEDPGESVICNRCPTLNLPVKIRPKIVADSKMYRLHSTRPGFFRCCYTDLIFEVRAAVTLSYHFDSWRQHLNERKAEQWMVAGPLLNIQADPEEAVASVHFPHFLCLAGKGSPQVYIAHFVEEGMKLEKPDRVIPFHAVWENPRFSPCGVVFKRSLFKQKIKVHAMAMLYQELEAPTPKFHLYLLPNDSSLKKAVHKHEEMCPAWRVQKPPGTFKPLTLGSCFFMQKLADVRVCPKELKLIYLDANMEQQYFELYAEHMQDQLDLILMEKNKNEKVWEAYVRREELKKTSVLHPVQETHPSVLHFIDLHREQLVLRTTNVEGVLDILHGSVLDEEQYQKISSRGTNPEKMRELYKLLPSWNNACKDQLYEALQAKQKPLIDDLEGR